MNKPLYELTGQLKELEKLAEFSEMQESVADTIEAIEGEFNDKAIALISVSKTVNGDIESCDAEIKRLTARKKVLTNKREDMIEYLRFNMEANDINKISCPLFTITLAKAKDTAVIDKEDEIPTDYVDIKMVKSPMKKEILAALKTGEVIPGCHLGKSKRGLLIK